MTTPDRPPDERDPRVAAWLAVEPLDDVTRARLVRVALAGAEASAGTSRSPRRLAPILAGAAVFLAVLVVGLAALVPRGDDPRPTAIEASPEPESSAAPRRADDSGTAGPAASPESLADEATPLVLPSLGALGEVSTRPRLERAASARLTLPAGPGTITVTGCAASAGRAFGTPIAAGSGRIEGRPAVVLVSEQPSGTTAVVAVRGRTCARGVSVVLP